MSRTLEELNGFQSLEAGLFLPWNTPFGRVREILREKQARDIEERGMRNIRFEETVDGTLDVQYELYFSPDYSYGLRSATAELEQIDHKSYFKDSSGSFRPLVTAYFRILELLRGKFGEPSLVARLDAKDPEKLRHTLDHTREQTTALASWSGTQTHVSHELMISFMPRHLLRFSPVNSRLLVVNRTGKPGLMLNVDFPGGSAQANMMKDQERVVELPLQGDLKLRVELAGRTTEMQLPIDFDRRTLTVSRSWLTGALSIKPDSP
jgi:hypothetical protein